MKKNNIISCIYFTTESDKGYYDDYPSFLKDIWPSLEAHLHEISNIYAFTHKLNSNLGKLDRRHEITKGFFDLEKGDSLPPELLSQVQYLSFYGGDRNIFYKISIGHYLIEFLSMWPYKSKTFRNIDVLGFVDEDLINLNNFVNMTCHKDNVLITFIHDADSICVIGQYYVLEDILLKIEKGN